MIVFALQNRVKLSDVKILFYVNFMVQNSKVERTLFGNKTAIDLCNY